ncbi:MAG: ferredoxin-type protein NapH, partial [Polaribacter sp.]
MKRIKHTGLIVFLIGLAVFIGTIFSGSFNLTTDELDTFIKEKNYKNELIKDELTKAIVTTENLSIFKFSSRVINAFKVSNDHYDALISKYDSEKNWDKK